MQIHPRYSSYRTAFNIDHKSPQTRGLVFAIVGDGASTFLKDRTIYQGWGIGGVINFPILTCSTGIQSTGPAAISGWESGNLAVGGLFAPSALRITEAVTILWFGSIRADVSGFAGTAYIAGMSYDSGAMSPFDAYVITRPNADNTTIRFNWNDAGVLQQMDISGGISSSDYMKPMCIALTISSTGIYGYKNGKIAASAAGLGGSIQYGTNPVFSFGCTGRNPFTPTTNIGTSLVAIWNQALTPTDHMLLGINPYRIFGRNHGGGGNGKKKDPIFVPPPVVTSTPVTSAVYGLYTQG